MKLKTKKRRRYCEVLDLRSPNRTKSVRKHQIRYFILPEVPLYNGVKHEPSTPLEASLPAKPTEEEVYAAGMRAFENLLNDYGDVLDALAKY